MTDDILDTKWDPSTLLPSPASDREILAARELAAFNTTLWQRARQGAALSTGVSGVFELIFIARMHMDIAFLYFLVTVVAGLSIGILSAKVSLHKEKASLLTPISETDFCVDAKDLVDAYKEARAVRDKALEQGRQLYVIDYVVMRRAVEEQRKLEAAARKNAACRELHQVSA